MQYISTRNGCEPVSSAHAINLGLAPDGGLFVPAQIPCVAPHCESLLSYQETALRVLSPLLPDFSTTELERCVADAYNDRRFDTAEIVALPKIGDNRWILELWHGPTAAFKDMALQIMPLLLGSARKTVGEKAHTVILVATSGDTGKAALEGFKDRDGISIIVFYPHEGVSEIQQLQMATTDGDNTHVIAVRGNFDDCQNGVKQLFGDKRLWRDLAGIGVVFSSANSINWGRLCPQIVYYYRAYELLVSQGALAPGQELSFAVPTGNFGNILAAYYARQMGLPIGRLFCASNRNRILTDFFQTGTYDRNREFYRTMSPSMDILISSNLERFLFEMVGHNGDQVQRWHADLASGGVFSVDENLRRAMSDIVVPGWVDEPQVREFIGRQFRRNGYVLDPHTAVAAAVVESAGRVDEPVVIDATASPYKFSTDVLEGLTGERTEDEFDAIERIVAMGGPAIHPALDGLREKPVRHKAVIAIDEMEQTVRTIVQAARSSVSQVGKKL